MFLEIEERLLKQDPATAQVVAAITKLRSHRPSSFASLTDEHGNYLQVAGGELTCSRTAVCGRWAAFPRKFGNAKGYTSGQYHSRF